MEIARHVLDTYFRDTLNPLVRHHLDSYGDLLQSKIPNFIQASNPLSLILGDGRNIEIYVAGKDGKHIKYAPPVDEMENAILPHNCRLDNRTYSLDILVDIEIHYTIGKDIEIRKFEDILLGRIPLMLKSRLCYLSPMTSDELYTAGECRYELGGYFIIGGAEKVLLTQERLGDNMFYSSKRKVLPSTQEVSRTLVEKETASKLEGGSKGEDDEYIAGIRSVSEDGVRGPYSHFLLIPPANRDVTDGKLIAKTTDYSIFKTKRLSMITLPGFTQPVPLISVFRALGFPNDQDIYDATLAGIPEIERTIYDDLFAQLIRSHDTFIKQEMAKEDDQNQSPDMLFLKRQVRTRSEGSVYVNLYDMLFPHCEKRDEESSSALYRRKGYLLGHMLRMAMDVALNIRKPSDRDHFRFKRLDASGDLIFQEFKKIYNDVGKRMLTELDTRIHFEQQAYEGKKMADLVKEENVGFYWRSYNFLNTFEKSFKGKWSGKDGVSQELTRLAYLGSVAHLRRVNLQMDKTTKVVEPRRIHGSSWGLMCPTDNPDGANIGMIKSLTIFCSLSTTTSNKSVVKHIELFPRFVYLSSIHPSVWDPSWTKVFLNSDLIGIVEADTEQFHSMMINKRRKGDIHNFVSLCWTRIDNEYIIHTDAGRPSRPVFREGTKADTIKALKTWSSMVSNHIDYIDAQESECLRISMEPFSPKLPSEIHGIVMFSASASIVPNADFNQAPRNMFSCQQTKQACSWFNTAFNKRFDTIATWLNYAQRPLSQTWTYEPINGCMPYGENPIVALATYTGYNQEDSIILNDSSLRRGLFHTSYYHSYDILEEMIDPAAQVHTEFINLKTNPKYKEQVIRKEGLDYDLLDSDGIIKVGSHVTDKTILVGILSPIRSATGELVKYKDVSYLPKRGQHGIIDSVYRFVSPEGILGVKIRIVEQRIPVLGDKFAARHGQKGTCGMRIPEEDMPYTSSGLRPDMIVNPHAFPSRMTIGQFLEMMGTKLSVNMGSLMDSTPFSASNRVEETKNLLVKAGYHPYGHELMYNGQTGEMLETEIFVGPTYYLRLKHMVEDKINYRSTGPKKVLTHQPVEGRSNDGGLRIGEMERDGLISHGVSKFLSESLMERSDKSQILFSPELGQFDARDDIEHVTMDIPYAMKLLLAELSAMHLSVGFTSS